MAYSFAISGIVDEGSSAITTQAEQLDGVGQTGQARTASSAWIASALLMGTGIAGFAIAFAEAALALGATPQQAVAGQLKRVMAAGMTPIVDNTKTVGLISLPGAMTGMILAGAPALEAVQVQIIVMYMLIGAAAVSGLTAAYLTYRQFFTRAHQLVTLLDREAAD